MANEFFKKILNFGKNAEADAAVANGEGEVSTERIDYIAKQQAIIEGVIANINGMVAQFGFKTHEHTLVIHVSEMMLYQSCLNDNFKAELTERLMMDCGYVFSDIEVKEGMPPADFASRKLTDSTFMYLAGGKKAIGKRARLTALEGSLMNDEMVLDSDTIDKLPGGRMNIGIGKHMRLQSGVIRINHIAVDDNPEGKHFEKNRYVSRAHAHITYNKNEGFVLTVEPGGTPVGNHRTMVYRNNMEHRMDIPGMAMPLVNGDQIILSRNVTLLFETLN